MLRDLHVDAPWALTALVPVALALGYVLWRHKKHLEPTLRFSSAALLDELPRTWRQRLRFLPELLRLLALAAVVFGLARPQLAAAPVDDETEGIDIVLVLDTSCSMRAADFQPNDRMFVAKKSIDELIRKRKSDRIALVVFGSEASTWVPLTLDYSLVARMLEQVEVGMAGDGTAIGSAIGTGLNRLRKSEAKSKVIILLTDGDNNAGTISPKKAAEFAKELGVQIYTILIGRGGPVPFPAGKDLFGRIVYKNQTIPTNPELLEEIASATGGLAYTASDKEELDERLSAVLDRLDRSLLEGKNRVVSYQELFPYAVALAALALALELLLRSTWLRRFP